MNPFDLKGPDFLAFYAVGCAVIIGAIVVIRRLVSRSNNPAAVEAIADKLHPTEVAYLVGGVTHAIEAAVTGLHHRGYIETDVKNVLRATGNPGATVLDANGVFRGVVLDERLSRVEALVMDRLPATVADITRHAGPVEIVLRQTLVERGLLLDNQLTSRLWMLAPALFWLGIGAIKIGVGISRAKPVGLLGFLVFAGLIAAIAIIKPPRLTTKGRELARYLKRRYGALEATAKSAPEQLDGTDMMLAYGVFGSLVAPVLLASALPGYQAAMAKLSVGAGGTGCGSGGCGSSCGGGCGGGCGGCG